jgi:protein-disulfide isomerase
MEENTPVVNPVPENNPPKMYDLKPIAGAIVLAGVLIAGAILLKDSSPQTAGNLQNTGEALTTLPPVEKNERMLGGEKAKVTVVMYEDFQCPFCGAISGLHDENSAVIQYLKKGNPTWSPMLPGIKEYVSRGEVRFVYRDYPFLGPESLQAAVAARCAEEQGKFWEYHDHLYANQQGENEGAFADDKLKGFAQTLGLNTGAFDSCLTSGKYSEEIAAMKTGADAAGVRGTPKGYILKGKDIVATIDGAEPWSSVKPKIDSALR